uniref:Uncharacterized protein n=1 Tax=Trichobilharzia regenti TaxID=157069 RepID=A0AA85JIF4_TRIRE|nr:unnamed protein product [Trichobilharzia regenti]
MMLRHAIFVWITLLSLYQFASTFPGRRPYRPESSGEYTKEELLWIRYFLTLMRPFLPAAANTSSDYFADENMMNLVKDPELEGCIRKLFLVDHNYD